MYAERSTWKCPRGGLVPNQKIEKKPVQRHMWLRWQNETSALHAATYSSATVAQDRLRTSLSWPVEGQAGSSSIAVVVTMKSRSNSSDVCLIRSSGHVGSSSWDFLDALNASKTRMIVSHGSSQRSPTKK